MASKSGSPEPSRQLTCMLTDSKELGHVNAKSLNYLPYRVIKLTSPNLNYFLISGVVMMYSSVYIGLLFTTNETRVHVRCFVSLIECKYRVLRILAVKYCKYLLHIMCIDNMFNHLWSYDNIRIQTWNTNTTFYHSICICNAANEHFCDSHLLLLL